MDLRCGASLIQDGKVDWNRLMGRARELRCRRIVWMGLRLARDLMGTAVPDEIWREVRDDHATERLVNRVRRSLFDPSGESRDCRSIFWLEARESVRDRIPYFLHLVRLVLTPSAADRTFLELPRPLSFLYFFVRLIRVVKSQGAGPAKRLWRVLSRTFRSS